MPDGWTRARFSEACRQNWDLAHFAWDKTLADNRLPGSLDIKADNLTALFHSLGATRAALCLAYCVYLGYEVYQLVSTGPSGETWQNFAFAFANIPLFLILMFVVLSHARSNTLRSNIALKHDIITYYHRRPVFGETPAPALGR